MTLKNGMSQVPISPDSPYSNKSVLTHSSLLDSFPSSQAFDAINDVLTANEAEQKDAVKKGGAIFTFNLKNSQGQEEAWYLDLKESGTVGKGAAPAGKKSDGAFAFALQSVVVFLPACDERGSTGPGPGPGVGAGVVVVVGVLLINAWADELFIV